VNEIEILEKDVATLWADFKAVEAEMIEKRTRWSEAFTKLNGLKREQEIEEIVRKRIAEAKP